MVNRPKPTQAIEQRAERGGIRRCVRGLRLHQRVDDTAEQNGLGELGRREQDIGDGQNPGEPGLRLEQGEHAAIKLEEIHALGSFAGGQL